MDKQQSQLIKGIAILVMVYGHLFSNPVLVATRCCNVWEVAGVPLATYITRLMVPVPFFLIVGGYGLWKVWQMGDRHRWSRILRLFIHFWIITLIFVLIGSFVNPARYPGDILDFVKSVTAYEPRYNPEMWFLAPYVILSLISPWLFRLYSRFRGRWIILSTLGIHLVTSLCISRYGSLFLYSNYWAYDILCVFHMLFNFSLGAMAARYGFFERLSEKVKTPKKRNIVALGTITLLGTIACMFSYNYFYVFLIIACVNIATFPSAIRGVLIALGNHSMNIWMVHTYYCAYLFRDLIYSFRYPVVIFAIVVLLSLITSIGINSICRPIEQVVFKRRRGQTIIPSSKATGQS